MKDLIAELRSARLAQQLTQQEVADAAGIPRTTVKDMEAGTCTPLLSTFMAVAYVLGLRVDLVRLRPDVEALLTELTAERFVPNEKES